MSTTNPTLPVLLFNMYLHSDKPATNCLPQVTACSALHSMVFGWGNLSGIYLCRSDVKYKGKSGSGKTIWENASYRKMWSVTVCESLTWYITDKTDIFFNNYVTKSPTVWKVPTFSIDSLTALSEQDLKTKIPKIGKYRRVSIHVVWIAFLTYNISEVQTEWSRTHININYTFVKYVSKIRVRCSSQMSVCNTLQLK